MTDRKIRTMAYTKSPKASKRTTFQGELETAVSARSKKKTTAQYTFSDEDDNDFLKDLLKSRKKRIDAFAAMKNMAKMNDFDLSDDEGENSRPKRVSFLKTQRVVASSEDIMASDSHKDEHLPVPSNSNQNDSSDSVSAMDRTHSQSPSESPVLLPGSSEQMRDSVHEEGSKANSPQPLETSSAHISTDGIVEGELPTPKPRTRTRALRSQGIVDQTEEDTGSPQSRAMTSSVSIPLSGDTVSNSTTASSPHRATSRSSSLPVPGRDQVDSITSSEARTERSRSLPISTVDSGTKDYHTSDDSKDHEGKYSTSFEEFHGNSEEHSISRLSHGPEQSSDTRTSSLLTKSPRRSKSVCSSKVTSKYMGTLKVLDRKLPAEDSQPEAADSLRAAIYQEWLQKKMEKLRENMQLKTQEDKLKEENKTKQEQDKREHAILSYNAWKEKKSETLKAKAKEKHATTRKEQRAIEEKEEKKEAAIKMFEKWKQEHEEKLKEKYRQQRGAESKCKQKKQHTEEERKKDSNSAFSAWNEKKKNFVMKQITEEHKEHQNKVEEDTYLKEEKDKMALEMYEKWLIKKEREQRRQREERKIQAILDDEPPPPWSPPNKTIPYGK